MRRRSFLQAGMAGAVAVTLPRISIAQPANTRVLRFVPQANLTLLDPIITTAAVTANHAWMVWDTLFGVNAAQQAKPQMAEGYTISDNGRTWMIRLRGGLKWHDGEPVRAQDCAASLARWAMRDTFGQTIAKVIDAWGAADDRTIKITLKQPFPLLIDAIAKPDAQIAFMMPERLAKTDPYKTITEIVGSGPFRFMKDEFVAGSSAAWEKFDGYVPRQEAPDWTARAPRSPTSSGSSGRSFRMPPPRPPRCKAARWTGTSRFRPILFRCCGATAISRSPHPTRRLYRRAAVQSSASAVQ